MASVQKPPWVVDQEPQGRTRTWLLEGRFLSKREWYPRPHARVGPASHETSFGNPPRGEMDLGQTRPRRKGIQTRDTQAGL